MQRAFTPILLVTAILVLQPAAASAYIGPGVGAGAIAAVLGVLGSVFLAIVAVVYYPIKRMLKGRKVNNAKAAPVEKTSK